MLLMGSFPLHSRIPLNLFLSIFSLPYFPSLMPSMLVFREILKATELPATVSIVTKGCFLLDYHTAWYARPVNLLPYVCQISRMRLSLSR